MSRVLKPNQQNQTKSEPHQLGITRQIKQNAKRYPEIRSQVARIPQKRWQSDTQKSKAKYILIFWKQNIKNRNKGESESQPLTLQQDSCTMGMELILAST